MKSVLLSVFCIFILSIKTYCQNYTDIRTSIHNVYVISKYETTNSLKPGFFGEISFGEKLNGEKYWHYYYGFPSFYISCYAGYPGNVDYGYLVGIIPQFSFNKIIKNNWNYNIKSGCGIAYLTNPYNIKYNPNNVLIGSKFNGIITVEAGISYQFQKYNYLGISVDMFHITNGKTKIPNKTMNLSGLNVFYEYRLKDDPKDIDYKYRDKINENWNLFINLGIGINEYGTDVKPTNGPNYSVYDIGFGISKKTNPIHKYRLGINILQYESYEKFITYQELNIGNAFFKSIAFNIFGAHEFIFGEFSLYTEIGLDIYKPFYRNMLELENNNNSFTNVLKSYNSNKIGIKYYFVNSYDYIFSGGINIKANNFQADFMEIICNFEF